jgi:hypothetical protein
VFAEPYGITLRRPVTLKRFATDFLVLSLGMRRTPVPGLGGNGRE